VSTTKDLKSLIDNSYAPGGDQNIIKNVIEKAKDLGVFESQEI